ncbi:catalase-domain-containing protein [Wallemia mellicola]|uniref:catalase n=1 Tax=Wallemia mellicola TaxID=1708541 RepID=A0A4T0M2A3_9BASI|nr:catalase-domain-containing protein [Wallemia mellicola]
MSYLTRTALAKAVAASNRTAARTFTTTIVNNELKKFDFPAMSPTMTEGGIASWKKQAGETFSAGDVLLEIETDKATIDVEAQDDGVVAKIILNDGAKNIPVGAPIAVLGEEGDDLSAADAVAQSAETAPETTPKEESKEEVKPVETSTTASEPKDTHVDSQKPLFPSVSRLLVENGISDAGSIKGTGRHGMLTRGDVLAYLGKIDNPRGTMKQVVDKQAKEAAEFKPFETTKKADAPKKDEGPLDYVSIRSIITAGLSKKIAQNAASAAPKSEDSASFDEIIAPYLEQPKPKVETLERTPETPKKTSDYLDGFETSDNKAFINPIQEFNRDLSVAAIRVWSEIVRTEKSAKFKSKRKGKKNAEEDANWKFKFSILDALSATGLRAIRYAKEIPNADKIYANDFLPDAVEAIRRNAEYNNVADKVKPVEGDASALMYQHRSGSKFDVVDLDPYGTAAPFVDAAVQCLSSGDTAVMAGTNYPEKCYANYGGTPIRAEYSHEGALRLILNSLSQSAARYGRYIEPLMSLSIDFYVRMWVRVHDGSGEVKKAFSKTGSVHVCSFCRQHAIQPFGRITVKTNEKGNTSSRFQAAQAINQSDKCSECGAQYHTNGPMWIDRIHNKDFTKRMLEHIDQNADKYGTAVRMKGMVSVADGELEDSPFYFTTDSVASAMRMTAPPMVTIASGLVNAGYQVSRSHALAGSIKTNAPSRVIHDMFRKWMKTHPIKLENIKEGSPTRVLAMKEAEVDADLTHNQAVVDLLGSKEKLRRYQSNPANWGPLAKPNSGPQNTKNSSEEHANDNATSDDVDIHKSKKAKIDMSVYDSNKPVQQNTKLEQLATATRDIPVEGEGSIHRTTFGSKADNVELTMKAGRRGPTLLSDPVFRDKISHFDHERIPERVVHARGDAAHGFFKLHTSLEDVTHAKILTDTETETPTFVRFSTVLGSAGAAETAREVRGFATRFYTSEGNWDIVGNNIPVFFIQDPTKFVDLIHAAKPDPKGGLPQAQTAHDNFWDYMSLLQESPHMVSWILSDQTIPRSYRMVQGFSVNTFVLVNKEGKRTFVKFHWKPHLGKHSLCWDEALKLGGQDPDYLRRDLQMFIDAGIYPKYELGVQLVPEEDEDKFSFDLLDCTKVIPEEEVPIKWVGTMTLNKTVTDQFAENEQVAFCTQNIVPGIDYSDDPMLHISRLGGINFSQLPINQPLPQACPFMNTLRDGYSSKVIPSGPNYYPNRFNNNPRPASVEEGGLHFPPYQVSGKRERNLGEKFFEFYDQATLHFNSLSDVEKANFISTALFEMGRCDDVGVRSRMVERLNNIDHDMAVQVGEGLGVECPPAVKKNHGRKTDGANPVSMLSKNNVFKPEGRLIALIAPDGYDHQQAVAIQNAFLALGNIVAVVGLRKGPTYGKQKGQELPTNFTFESARSTLFDSVIFLDGDDRYKKTLNLGRVKHWCIEAYAHFKAIALIGTSAEWGSKLIPVENRTDGGKSFSVQDGVVVAPKLTSQDTSLFDKLTKGVIDAASFAGAYAQAVASHRHWQRDPSELAY